MTKIKKIEISYHISRKVIKEFNTVKIKKELQEIMWDNVGITRTYLGLIKAREKIARWKSYLNMEFTDINQFELANLIILADLVIKSALIREESRGAHYRQDFPDRDDINWKKSIEC